MYGSVRVSDGKSQAFPMPKMWMKEFPDEMLWEIKVEHQHHTKTVAQELLLVT